MRKARGSHCRLCGSSATQRKLTTHHLVPRWKLLRRGQTGIIGHPNNLILLCDPCHRHVEKREAAGGDVWRARLRGSLTAAEVVFIRDTMGAGWLQWRYPIEPNPRRLPEPTQLVLTHKGEIKEDAAPLFAATSTLSEEFPEGNDGDWGAV